MRHLSKEDVNAKGLRKFATVMVSSSASEVRAES